MCKSNWPPVTWTFASKRPTTDASRLNVECLRFGWGFGRLGNFLYCAANIVTAFAEWTMKIHRAEDPSRGKLEMAIRCLIAHHAGESVGTVRERFFKIDRRLR